ncbi:MAG: hypothetical protein LBH01_01655 [Verrucomicrobiales bacterium]|jgi:hypothetical protein|nr:hypothetical protein [Verrucomicrobiales bacterium]
MTASRPTPATNTLEHTLLHLAPHFARQADALLDLRDYGIKRQHPGKCVDCYFQLHANARDTRLQNLAPLREWLERNIEIVAADQKQNLLEKIPLKLDAQDLESFCQKIINFMYTDRAFQTPTVSLDFAFKA